MHGFHIQHPFFHSPHPRSPLEFELHRTYHELMRTTPQPEGPDGNLEARLVVHYSRVADWLGSRTWYRDEDVTRVVKFLIPGRPKRILELCCGTGMLLNELGEVYPDAEIVGIDISPTMVERAKERLHHLQNVQVLQGDWISILSTSLSDAFDVVIVKNALHLMDNLQVRLADLWRICSEWTVLIVVETVSPNVEANAFIRRLFNVIDVGHLKQNFFTEQSLVAALAESGWVIAQDRAWHVRQHIDTEDWLRQRCKDQLVVEAARKLLSEVRNARVRQSMDFHSELGKVPAQMLRLQYIARHIYRPVSPKRPATQDEELELQFE